MSIPVGDEIDDGSGNGPSTHGREGGPSRPEVDADATHEQVRRLERELERLRERTRLAQRTQFRRMAAVLAVVGLATLAAGWYLPDSRDVLFALGGTALFATVLLFFLDPERLVPTTAGEYVYTALVANSVAMIQELGLQGQPVYVPRSTDSTPSVSLFVPLHPDHRRPENEELDSLFVVTDDAKSRGVSLRPSASDLLGEFVYARSRELDGEPERLVDQLTDGLLDTFGAVESTTGSVDVDGGRASVAVAGSAYGPVDRFDNPVTSFLAAGIAAGLESPVTVEVNAAEGSAYDHVVTCRWPTEGM